MQVALFSATGSPVHTIQTIRYCNNNSVYCYSSIDMLPLTFYYFNM